MRIWIALLHLDRAYRTLRPLLPEYDRRRFRHVLRSVRSMFWARVGDWFRAKWVDRNGRRVQVISTRKNARWWTI